RELVAWPQLKPGKTRRSNYSADRRSHRETAARFKTAGGWRLPCMITSLLLRHKLLREFPRGAAAAAATSRPQLDRDSPPRVRLLLRLDRIVGEAKPSANQPEVLTYCSRQTACVETNSLQGLNPPAASRRYRQTTLVLGKMDESLPVDAAIEAPD